MADDTKGEMDFSKVIFLLLVKIHNAAGVDTDQYIALVEAFSDTMFPYHMDNGLELGDEQKKYDRIDKLDDADKEKPMMMKEASKNLARAKFRALMRLAEEKNLLLTRVSRDEVWELDDEDEAEDN